MRLLSYRLKWGQNLILSPFLLLFVALITACSPTLESRLTDLSQGAGKGESVAVTWIYDEHSGAVTALQAVADSVIFSSANKDQVSTWYNAKRHSTYTYFFLKGLGGEADAIRDRTITAGELQGYLAKEVPYWANREANRNQTPLMTGAEIAVLAKLR